VPIVPATGVSYRRCGTRVPPACWSPVTTRSAGQVWPDVKVRRFPPGRAQVVDRSGVTGGVQLTLDSDEG
jgi:hypothetical protein